MTLPYSVGHLWIIDDSGRLKIKGRIKTGTHGADTVSPGHRTLLVLCVLLAKLTKPALLVPETWATLAGLHGPYTDGTWLEYAPFGQVWLLWQLCRKSLIKPAGKGQNGQR